MNADRGFGIADLSNQQTNPPAAKEYLTDDYRLPD